MLGFGALGEFALGEGPIGAPPGGRQSIPALVQRIRTSAFDKSVGLNPNLFTNRVPNNQYAYPSPMRVRRSPIVLDGPFNPNLFKNPVPIFNHFESVWRVADFIPPSNPYNQNLYTIVITAQPFNQTDWPRTTRLRGVFDQTQAFNPNLFTNPLPFAQFDWAKPVRISGQTEQPAVGINPNIFTNPLPFAAQQQGPPIRRALTQPTTGFNPNLSIVISTVPILNFASTITYRFRISLPDNSVGFLITRPVTPPPSTTLIQRTLTGVGL